MKKGGTYCVGVDDEHRACELAIRSFDHANVLYDSVLLKEFFNLILMGAMLDVADMELPALRSGALAGFPGLWIRDQCNQPMLSIERLVVQGCSCTCFLGGKKLYVAESPALVVL